MSPKSSPCTGVRCASWIGRRLQALVNALPPAQPRRLAMDEFAVFKGHRYAMDMNTAFDLEVRHHCRRARIVYDLFHVVAKYGREVVTRVRVDAANKLREDKPARCSVKQAHWLLLRNRSRLSEQQQVQLDEVLAANQSILTAYVMQEQLKTLWTAPSAWDWRQRWKQWMAHAKQSAIPVLERFARNLKPYWRGIVSRVRWPMHTGQLEGINVVKRMAYGYRNTQYFFLKIKAALPVNP